MGSCQSVSEDKLESVTKRKKPTTTNTTKATSKVENLNPSNVIVELSSRKGVERGVTIQFLLDLCVKQNLWNKPTSSVCENIIMPACETGGSDGGPCRYVDLPSLVEKGIVGRAKTFVSHAWGAPFGLIVVALLEGEPDMNRHVWIDIFAVLQFEPKPEGELRIDLVIPDCSSFLLVVPHIQQIRMMDYDAAKRHDRRRISEDTFRQLPLYRLWCLAEIFTAVQHPGMVVVVKVGRLLKRKNSIGGYQLDTRDLDDFLRKLAAVVNVEQAKTSMEADRVRILTEHKDELPLVDAKVRELCDAARLGDEDDSTMSLVSCAAMGDSGALSRVANETDVEKKRAYQRVCAGRGFTTLLRDLLDMYPKVDRAQDLLVTAAQGGQVHCVRLLIEYKFNINADRSGRTACMNAAYRGYTECLQLLLEAGADVHVEKNGHTALKYARGFKHSDCVALLESHGAK